jgi:hypothetical protein
VVRRFTLPLQPVVVDDRTRTGHDFRDCIAEIDSLADRGVRFYNSQTVLFPPWRDRARE